MEEEHTCCFIGHRKIPNVEEIAKELANKLECLIREEKVVTFLFGSRSDFDALCFDLVTALKNKYPQIKRVYVRAEYPHLQKEYEEYLLRRYEDTYYPERLLAAGRAVYVERNFEMIERSRFCIVYYDPKLAPKTRRSGTEIAVKNAHAKGKTVWNAARLSKKAPPTKKG